MHKTKRIDGGTLAGLIEKETIKLIGTKYSDVENLHIAFPKVDGRSITISIGDPGIYMRQGLLVRTIKAKVEEESYSSDGLREKIIDIINEFGKTTSLSIGIGNVMQDYSGDNQVERFPYRFNLRGGLFSRLYSVCCKTQGEIDNQKIQWMIDFLDVMGIGHERNENELKINKFYWKKLNPKRQADVYQFASDRGDLIEMDSRGSLGELKIKDCSDGGEPKRRVWEIKRSYLKPGDSGGLGETQIHQFKNLVERCFNIELLKLQSEVYGGGKLKDPLKEGNSIKIVQYSQ